jgi:hypothetical protein
MGQDFINYWKVWVCQHKNRTRSAFIQKGIKYIHLVGKLTFRFQWLAMYVNGWHTHQHSQQHSPYHQFLQRHSFVCQHSQHHPIINQHSQRHSLIHTFNVINTVLYTHQNLPTSFTHTPAVTTSFTLPLTCSKTSTQTCVWAPTTMSIYSSAPAACTTVDNIHSHTLSIRLSVSAKSILHSSACNDVVNADLIVTNVVGAYRWLDDVASSDVWVNNVAN